MGFSTETEAVVGSHMVAGAASGCGGGTRSVHAVSDVDDVDVDDVDDVDDDVVACWRTAAKKDRLRASARCTFPRCKAVSLWTDA